MATPSRASLRSRPRAIALVLLALAAPVSAQDPLEGRTILTVHVSGLSHIKESVVLAQIESAPGQPYHRATADSDEALLERLGVFAGISVTARALDEGVQLDVTLTETPNILPTLGVSVTDENGVAGGVGVKVLSLGGVPRDMSLTTRFGGQTLFEFHEAPSLLRGRSLWHAVTLSARERFNTLGEFNERSLDLDVRIGRRVSEQWKIGGIFQIYRVGSDVDGITLSSTNHDTFLSFGGVAEYDSRDSWQEPSRGWLNSVDALWRTGSGSYTSANVDLRRYQPVAARQTIIATALVTLQSGTRGVDVPGYADYAIGGENSVRGRAFATRRGKNQLITSLEYRVGVVPARSFHVAGLNLYGGIAVAVFGDLGSAWNHSTDFSKNLIGGVGIGLRLFVPYVNVVRLDLSVGGGSLLFGFAGNEKAVVQRRRVR